MVDTRSNSTPLRTQTADVFCCKGFAAAWNVRKKLRCHVLVLGSSFGTLNYLSFLKKFREAYLRTFSALEKRVDKFSTRFKVTNTTSRSGRIVSTKFIAKTNVVNELFWFRITRCTRNTSKNDLVSLPKPWIKSIIYLNKVGHKLWKYTN